MSSNPQAASTRDSETQPIKPLGRAQYVLHLPTGAKLTLSEEGLLLPAQTIKKPSRSCGLGTSAPNSSPNCVPYYNVLWAEVTDDQAWVRVDFAEEIQPHRLGVQNVKFPIDPSVEEAGEWVERLLDRAYGGAARRKRAWVVVNPHAGPGGADKIWQKQVKPIFQAARMPLTVVRTSYSGEAVEMVRALDIDEYDIVVPCSGDGLPHEVFNGLGKRPDARRALSKIAVCHIPCGSGNAMSCNLYGTHRPSLAALAIVKGVPTPMDLVSITQGERRTLSFLSQALGMVADLDITTEHLRWMGAARFTYGFLWLAMQKKTYPCDIAVKVEIEHKDGIKQHYRNKATQSGSESDEPGEGPSANVHPPSSAPSSADGDEGQGLPPLKYGTVMDKLPDEWELLPHEKLGNFYCGNMAYMAPDLNFFSAALANDGLMDLVTVDGDISALKSIQLQLSVESGHFFDSPLVSYRKVVAYRIIPRENCPRGYISIDGESFPWEPFQAEIHKGLGLTLSKKGGYEAPGPLNWDTVTTTERLRA
ncbi:ATP-NAD kinase-like domain-containing protein [Echria macrotheca]|uniref:ATP-NAD kinase-like domain-containing protein n=1 Tax=Echria macrotheca TaxID=438768 RepID=A0AAJ0BL17_9PEZI|nr:ATP-NAD kinase-like domain-containing protein [Echria macrotheca]